MIPKIEIIGDVEQVSKYIPWAKKQWFIKDGIWYKDLTECLIEFKHVADFGYIRFFVKTTSGFVGHPRTGKLKQLPFLDNKAKQLYLTGVDGGGYFQKGDTWEEITSRFPYPLEDTDLGTFLVAEDIEWSADLDNYGNCWWTDGESTLSWRSNPNWHFPLDSSLNIPGLSRPEDKIGDTVYYTCFSNNIYSGGELLTTGPSIPIAFGSSIFEPALIAGAWYCQDILLCCSVTNKADTSGGYWLAIYKQINGTWERISAEFSTTRLHTPAFISRDGVTIVQGTDKYLIDIKNDGVAQFSVTTTKNIGNRIITGAGGYGSAYKYNALSEYWTSLDTVGEAQASLVTTKAAFQYSSVGNTTVQTKMVPAYRANPATSVELIKVSTNTYEARPNGSYCSISASASGGLSVSRVDGTQIILNDPVTCGTLSVMLAPRGVSTTVNVVNPVFISATETTCSYTPAGTGYLLSPTGYLKVTWALSAIPYDTQIVSVANILSATPPYMASCSGCHNSTPYASFDYPYPINMLDRKHIEYGGRLRYIMGYSPKETTCTGNNTNYSRGTVFDNTSSIRIVYATSGDIYCVSCGYCTKTYDSINLYLLETSFCSAWLDDSYKTSLTDIDGNSISVPNDNGAYLYKIAKVEVFECP